MPNNTLMKPNIVKLEQFKVIGLQTLGKPEGSEYVTLWDTLLQRSSEIQNMIDADIAYGIGSYTKDFPMDSAEFYMAGCEVNSFDGLPATMRSKMVPANTYAVFKHHGAIDTKLRELFHAIYHEWLPNSGYIQAGLYDFEKYGTDFNGPQNPNSVLEIYVPIKEGLN